MNRYVEAENWLREKEEALIDNIDAIDIDIDNIERPMGV